MKKGFSLVEALIVVIILSLVVALLVPTLYKTKRRSNGRRCKGNLDQIGKAMVLYLDDFGKTVRYPSRNGEGFLATLYQDDVLQEAAVFLCPTTYDINNNGVDLDAITGEGDSDGPISYAGRKNADHMNYPGIFRPTQETTTTPIAADDVNDFVEENHEDGEIIMFLFLDGHTDHIKSRNAVFSDYQPTYDPLTN